MSLGVLRGGEDEERLRGKGKRGAMYVLYSREGYPTLHTYQFSEGCAGAEVCFSPLFRLGIQLDQMFAGGEQLGGCLSGPSAGWCSISPDSPGTHDARLQ